MCTSGRLCSWLKTTRERCKQENSAGLDWKTLYVEREFIRKYELPQGAMPENVFSQISSEGVLTVTAPRRVTSSNMDSGGANAFIETLKRLSKTSTSSESEGPCQGNCFQK